MEVLKSWAVSIAAATAVTAALGFLSPTGVMDKSIKIIVALFMLICFLTPVMKSDLSKTFSSDVENISEWLSDCEVNKEVENKVESMLESTVHTRITAFLTSIGVSNSEINVSVKVDESNNIKIQKIDIKLFEKIDTKDLVDFVKTEYELNPVITYAPEE